MQIWEVLLDVQSFLGKSQFNGHMARSELATQLPLFCVPCHLILRIIENLVQSRAQGFI